MGKLRFIAFFSVVCLSLLLAGSNQSVTAYQPTLPAIQQSTAPKIVEGLIKGNKLLLTGENFDSSTMVMVNGRLLTPRFDPTSPNLLVIKKAFKKVAPGTVADIQAQNATGQVSETFPFFVGKTITFEDAGKTITLAIGEKVQVFIKSSKPYEWIPSSPDETILVKLPDAERVEGAQAVFQAVRAGLTKLFIVGDPCPNLDIQCGLPSIQLEVNIKIE
ncbi:MAG: hypothetical protein AB1757_01845 [Acidobacteriota bacterium]